MYNTLSFIQFPAKCSLSSVARLRGFWDGGFRVGSGVGGSWATSCGWVVQVSLNSNPLCWVTLQRGTLLLTHLNCSSAFEAELFGVECLIAGIYKFLGVQNASNFSTSAIDSLPIWVGDFPAA